MTSPWPRKRRPEPATIVYWDDEDDVTGEYVAPVRRAGPVERAAGWFAVSVLVALVVAAIVRAVA